MHPRDLLYNVRDFQVRSTHVRRSPESVVVHRHDDL